MDTFAHGIWGGVTFGRKNLKMFLLAVLIGMAPDLFSFGPHFFHWALAGFPDYPIQPGTTGAPALTSLPDYVFVSYNVTHSLIIWAAAFSLLWLLRKRVPWIFCAWALHIVCDIPSHTTRYFPTPFLWPFPTPYIEGIHWARPAFMITNYLILFLIIVGILWMRIRSRKREGL